ncbi:MAG: hypothetical protein K2X94_01225, partial [Amoebophilaceae bacterium]|nr:hypothetical protein [Amoebophilaceae bacterium]
MSYETIFIDLSMSASGLDKKLVQPIHPTSTMACHPRAAIAEISFQELFSHTLGDYMLLILLLWRICTFYLYLAMGALFIPKWI